MLLTDNIKVTSALNYADGTAVREGAILDMSGYEGVVAIVKCAALHNSAVGDIHWEQGANSALSDAADLAGTAIAIAGNDDNQIFMSDLYKPLERYVRVVVTKDTSNTMAESAVYIQYGCRKGPITNTVTDTLTAEQHVSPAEGTK